MPSLREQKKSATQANGSRRGSRVSRRWRWLWAEKENGALDARVVQASETSTPAQSDSAQDASVFSHLAPLKIIAWLGASAGGLTILLVTMGFLALSAHDAMLGIPRSFQNNQEYVAVGGLFFGRSIMFLVAGFILVKSGIVLGILLAGVVVFFRIPRRLCRGRSLVIALFSVTLLVAEVYGLARLIRPLQISNLLLNPSVDANPFAREIVEALLVKNTTWLSAEYGFLVLLVLAFSIAFIFLEHESRERVVLNKGRANRTLFWRLARVPAFILLLICIFLLPRAYGVLTISNDYPAVSVESSTPSSSTAPNETRLLLREEDKFFVLFDPTSQSIVTVKRDSITQHRMYAPQHIFTASGVKK